MKSSDFAAARAYARGYLAGEYSATHDAVIAARVEARVVAVLRELGVTPAAAKTILVQARHDAHLAVPECTPQAARLIAANMVASIIRGRLAREAMTA